MTQDNPTHGLRVSIVRWIDDAQPGWVECHLTDASGRLWSFVEKAPVVSHENLGAESTYPRRGVVACRVARRGSDNAGRELVLVDTTTPWGIAATSGETHFEVLAEQIVEWPCSEPR